jgi:hypothetical protein
MLQKTQTSRMNRNCCYVSGKRDTCDRSGIQARVMSSALPSRTRSENRPAQSALAPAICQATLSNFCNLKNFWS